MGRVNQVKSVNQDSEHKSLRNDFVTKVRLNVNDLMKRRQEERRIDKKTNILIFSGATAVVAVVIVILSL